MCEGTFIIYLRNKISFWGRIGHKFRNSVWVKDINNLSLSRSVSLPSGHIFPGTHQEPEDLCVWFVSLSLHNYHYHGPEDTDQPSHSSDPGTGPDLHYSVLGEELEVTCDVDHVFPLPSIHLSWHPALTTNKTRSDTRGDWRDRITERLSVSDLRLGTS